MRRETSGPLAGRIFTIRGRRVVLDADLAKLCGVTTKAFNQAIKRNASRFPTDFAFQLSSEETADLKSQIVTSSLGSGDTGDARRNWSRSVTSSETGKHGGRRKSPRAFTEHGAVMAANVLRSAKAVQMSVHVVRAFVQMRDELMANAGILKRLAEIDRTLIEHDASLRIVWKRLQPLLSPPPEKPRQRIGFQQFALPDRDGFDVHELLDTVVREFAAEAAVLDSAERRAGVALHEAGHEATAGAGFLDGDALAGMAAARV